MRPYASWLLSLIDECPKMDMDEKDIQLDVYYLLILNFQPFKKVIVLELQYILTCLD